MLDDLLGAAKHPQRPPLDRSRGRLLVADDHADMRDYLRRLPSPRWEVELVPDGEAALAAARRERPDLVLAATRGPLLTPSLLPPRS